ncbi:MAG: ammonium transporter [Hyphomonadaceae bacterium]|nr:ammonium transporter [Hyphomonadaceae bacterium]
MSGRLRAALSCAAFLAISLFPGASFAQEAVANGADTAWTLTASALVLFMTLPGLALFYGGLVQQKNVLSVMMQCVAIACVGSLLWLAIGYTLAFGPSLGVIGGLDKAFFPTALRGALVATIPEPVFFVFQMTFAVITPALIVGAYVERIRFSAVVLFSALWLLVVYAPVAHWLWGGGWLAKMGGLDFAGGLVVHATAGASALVVAKMLGARDRFPSELHPPHAPGLTMVGAAMLWVGWYGFNGGSALTASADAGMAIMATHISACAAGVVWAGIEWAKFGRPSMVGAVTGVIAGLATVTPASGFVGPIGGLILGAAGAAVCFYAVQFVKQVWKVDDSLDVFAVHGVGGVLGTLLLAVLMSDAFGGKGYAEGATMGSQLGVQALGVVAVVAWSAAASFALVHITKALVGLRAKDEHVREGLDLSAHGERAQPD